MAEPTQNELNKFVKTVDDFLTVRQNVLAKRADVYASNDPALINDFENFSSQSTALKNTIEATTGAWNAAKSAYTKATDNTSMVIGDAVDWLRETFGDYKPMGGLGIIQLPAAAWIAGIIGAAVLLWRSGNALMIRIDAATIARKDNIPYSEALQISTRANAVNLLGDAKLPLMIALAAAVYYFWNNR